MNNSNTNSWFDISAEEIRTLVAIRRNPAGRTRLILILVTAFLTPITLLGSLLGFIRAYKRFKYPKDEAPDIYPLTPIMRVAMIAGAVLIWVVLFVCAWLFITMVPHSLMVGGAIFYYIGANLLVGILVFVCFRGWQIRINNVLVQGNKFGSARFARFDELRPYV